MAHDDIFRHIFDDEDGEALPPVRPSNGRKVRVSVRTTTGRARRVELPRDQVIGRRAEDVLREALTNIHRAVFAGDRSADYSDVDFAQNVAEVLRNPLRSLDMRVDDSLPQPVTQRTVIPEAHELVFEVGVDHVGG
ncbi:MAG: hypothetical protein H5T86_07160 [Armatimonadetes bacterium]|nr:hypothetical protein [Armatimonadota bacterium]